MGTTLVSVDTTALWMLSGIAIPQYLRSRKAARKSSRIPAAVLSRYHQSPEWRARKTAYNRHHPRVCVACLWLMPIAFWGWALAVPWRFAAKILFPIRRPLRWVAKVIRRTFKRSSLEIHHISYRDIWDGTTLHPGAEKNRNLMRLCTTMPVVSRVCGGCSHHAAADRVRRFCERTGLPVVAATRAWALKCWAVQATIAVLVFRLWRSL